MTTELTMLVFSTLLFFTIIMIQALMGIGQNGLAAQAGSRDGLPPPTVLRERMQRLTANLQENLLMFGVLVLVGHAAGVSNENTALGASLFFYARVAHALVYAAGLPWVRPLTWAVAVFGMILIAIELF